MSRATTLLARPTLFATLVLLAGCVSPDKPIPPPAAPSVAQGPCRPWVYFPTDSHSNVDSPYLGCINRANLEEMVARPADLEAGRSPGPANGARESLGVETYVEGKIKNFGTESIQGPSIVLPGGSGGVGQ